MKNSKIPWTTHTFNIAIGCTKVSQECANCYAESIANAKFRVDGQTLWGKNAPRKTLSESYWKQPLAWNRAAQKAGRRDMVFCSDMADLFEDHPTVEQERERLWPLIRQTPHLTWQLLTKRADRIEGCLPADWEAGSYENVWLGVTIGHRDSIWRADHLRAARAVTKFVSAEPLLTSLAELDLTGIDWVIVGGESGPAKKRREMEAAWARDLRDRCLAAGVAFFFKQISARHPDQGDLDGERIRQFPLPMTMAHE